MDRVFIQLPLAITVIIGGISFFIIFKVFFAKQFSRLQNKSQDNKLLLKQLLEGFGLEVPSELNEAETPVVKTIKGP